MLRDRMNKILITGGSGLLAVNLAQIIRNQYTVTLGLHSRSIQLKSTKSLKINLESTNSVLEAIDNVQPQLVIHTVGLVNVEYCEQHSDIAKHINVELTKNVAQACKSRNVQMIYISTDHLFNGKKRNFRNRSKRYSQRKYSQIHGNHRKIVFDRTQHQT